MQEQHLIPSQVNHVCLFILHLANNSLSHSTIRTYLSAISFVHKLHNADDPTSAFMVAKTLQGIKNLHGPSTNQRLPITKDILHDFLHSLPYAVPNRIELITWNAIFLFTFHACLRAGEVTLSRNPMNVIRISQLKLNDDHFTIQFQQYKHSKGRMPLVTVTKQPHGTPCPVSSLRAYINTRGYTSGQLFLNPDKSPITIQQFSNTLRNTVAISNLPTARYTTHSFRLGKATQMAMDGQPDQVIRSAGRWRSTAYTTYLRPDHITLPN